MRKKILIVSAVFPPEQVTSAFLNYDLAHEMAEKCDVTVLRPFPSRPFGTSFISADVEDKSFKTILIDSYIHPKSDLIGRFKEAIDFSNKVVKYIKVHKNDIVFVYNDGWQLFGLYIIAKACVKYCIPYIVPIQDIYPESLLTNKRYPYIVKRIIKSILLPFDKYYQQHAAYVRTISNEMRDYLSQTRKIPFEKFLVVNNWQNDEEFHKGLSTRTNDRKLVFAYVGSINEHANVDLMIKAFVEANIENAEFRIYGGGNKKDYCEKLVKQLEAKNIFFNIVARDKVPYVQSKADVLVMALPKGNGNLCLPSKMTSYMLSGKPILASVDEDSATTRFILEADCGISVKPDDIIAIKGGFLHFAHLKGDELKKLGLNSHSFAKKNLTREVNIHKVVEKIHNIMES